MRTPLAGITGAATTLMDDPGVLSDAERSSLLAAIQEEAFRMHRLVTNLLDLTRLESGAVRLNAEWVPAEELLGSAIHHLGRLGEGRQIEVSLEKPGMPLFGDPLLLEQVFINLLENALKFSPTSAPVQVKVVRVPHANMVLVADHGPGIPEGLELKIFEKLYRVPEQVSSNGTGAGLGLAICRGIIQAHEGSIQASNRSGGGAQFQVVIPFEGEPPESVDEEDSIEC